MALALSVTMLVPSQAVYATEGQAGESEVEAYAESRAVDADGFEIEDGVLRRYWGTAEEVVIPDGVESIGDGAFLGCDNLMEITIPKEVTSIGTNIFQNCISLTTIKVEEGNAVYDSRENCNAVIETESSTLIAGCKNTSIPKGVAGIGEWAFSCKSLISISIPEGVTDIKDYAFADCSELTSIIIPEGVASIGKCAFRDCRSLTEISIPKGVVSIEENAFIGCSGLKSVSISKEVESIGQCAFGSCDSLASIIVEEGNAVYDSRGNCNAIIEKKSNTLVVGCSNTVVPQSVTGIGSYTF